MQIHFLSDVLVAVASLDLKVPIVETSVTVNNNTPIQDYVHPDDQTQPTFEMTPGFKPFTIITNDNNDHFFHYLYWLVSQNVYWTCCSNLNGQNKERQLGSSHIVNINFTLTNKC